MKSFWKENLMAFFDLRIKSLIGLSVLGVRFIGSVFYHLCASFGIFLQTLCDDQYNNADQIFVQSCLWLSWIFFLVQNDSTLDLCLKVALYNL